MVALSSLMTALRCCQIRPVHIGLYGVLGGCLTPVLVDTVLELNDGEVADFERERFVDEDRL